MTPSTRLLSGIIAALSSTLFITTVKADYYTCYEQEYRCETHYEQDCRQERSCYTTPGDRQCSQERVCETRSVPPRCETVEECGTNAQGEPICKTRERCEGGGTVEECGYVERCYNVPGREECSYNNVCENRPAERCGYVNVPKQCYRPDPSPVEPDPTPVYPEPSPVYPEPTPIYPEPTPIDPEPVDPVPVEPQPGIGPDSVRHLSVNLKAQQSILVFKDSRQSPTYRTRYFISVYDASGDLVINQFSSDKSVQQKIRLNEVLSPKQRYKVFLKVQRSGGELLQDVEFTKILNF